MTLTTHEQAARVIFEFIEAFYKRQRLHTALNALSPAGFQAAALESPPARRRSPMAVEPLRIGAQRHPLLQTPARDWDAIGGRRRHLRT